MAFYGFFKKSQAKIDLIIIITLNLKKNNKNEAAFGSYYSPHGV